MARRSAQRMVKVDGKLVPRDQANDVKTKAVDTKTANATATTNKPKSTKSADNAEK